MRRKLLMAGLLVLVLVVSMFALAGCGEETTTSSSDEVTTTDESVVTIIADGETMITDAANDQYFGGTAGAAATGVEALLDAGAVYVNNLKVPATETETDLYQVNSIDGLWWNEEEGTWGFAVHKYVFNFGPVPPPELFGVTYLPKTFNEARLEFVQNLSQRLGRTVTLTLDPDTGQATRIDLVEWETVYIGSIKAHGSTTEINRSDYTLETDRYPIRSDVNNVAFPSDNVDQTIEVGDFAVWWLGPDGWHLDRAEPVSGILENVEKKTYSIGGDVRKEADCSRFNLAESVRPTQFYTAYARLGLTGLEATAWCMPDAGNPIGFTYGGTEAAKAALELAITNAEAAKADVNVSEAGDGSDVSGDAGTKWVAQDAMGQYTNAIGAAQAVLDDPLSAEITYTAAIYALGKAYGQGGDSPEGFIGSIGVK